MNRILSRVFMMSASRLILAIFLGSTSVQAEDNTEVAIELAALTNDELSEARARGGLEMLGVSESNMDADLTDNVVSGANTGNNAVSHGSFSEMNGFGVVVQNSGNHVIIQNSTIVNVIMQGN